MTAPRFRLDATLLSLVLCLGMGPMSTDMYLPGLPALAADFGVDAAGAQLSLTLFMLGFAIGHLVFGPFSDRFGRKPVVLGGLALYGASCALCALAPDYFWLLAGRVGQALGAACCVVNARAIVRDRYGAADSGRMMAYATSGMAIVAAFSPSTGGLLVTHFHWHAVFWSLLGVTCLLALLYGLRVPETLPPERRGQGGFRGQMLGLRILLSDRVFTGYLLTGAGVYSALFAFIAGAPYVFIDGLGVSPARFGLLFTTLSITYFFFSTVAGRIHGRFGARRLIGAGTLLTVAGGAIMLVLVLAGLDSVAGILLPQILTMTGMAFTLAQCYAAAIAPHPTLAGTGSALIGFGQMLIASLVAMLVGYAWDGTALPMAVGVFAMAVLGMASFRLLVLRAPAGDP